MKSNITEFFLSPGIKLRRYIVPPRPNHWEQEISRFKTIQNKTRFRQYWSRSFDCTRLYLERDSRFLYRFKTGGKKDFFWSHKVFFFFFNQTKHNLFSRDMIFQPSFCCFSEHINLNAKYTYYYYSPTTQFQYIFCSVSVFSLFQNYICLF